MTTFEIGWNKKRGTAADLESNWSWTNMDAVFRSRLLRLFAAAGGRVGFGGGYRSSAQQAAGNSATHVAPGRSWHEVGMAADLVGDLDWVTKNAARFGLQTGANWSRPEAWHVQPAEIPAARPAGAPAPRISGDGGGGESQGGSMINTMGETSREEPSFDMPPDAQMYRTIYGVDVALFAVAPDLYIQYVVSPDGSSNVNYSQGSVKRLSGAQWLARFPEGSIIEAGDAAELSTVKRTFNTFGNFWNSILDQVMSGNNPARDDPGVLKVIAEFAGRFDMTEAELQNKLQETEWFQKHTQDQLEWNSISEAEREKRIDETAARLSSTVWQYMGVEADESDPRVGNYVEKVASGEIGFGAYVEIIKGQAEDMGESPWARERREEEEAQRQRPIDIENTSQRIREASERWGVSWSPETITQWARQMVAKEKSDEDLVMEFRNQAQVLYPWKDPEVETATAAAPWMETYRRVMEKPASLSTPDVQRALQQGQAVFDFETDLKKSDGWLQTQNGQDAIYSSVSELGARMGFV